VKQVHGANIDSALETDFQQLKAQLHAVGVELHGAWIESLWDYARLLCRWAQKMNLVSAGDLTKIFTKHIGPACVMVSIVQSVRHRSIVDYGSGAGLPGIPLKIALPDSIVYLVESRRKRASFLSTVVRELGLSKVEVVNCRLQEWCCPSGPVDLVVSRAVAGARLADEVRTHLAPNGIILTSSATSTGQQNLPHAGTRFEFSGFPTVVMFPAR
jgi:16S rRNA (guanine527-N7)-methyltransferase